ncbi:Transposase IS116/IS110/IS902 family protein [Cereibacter sphaeroides KD131]|nr:Transposase IS116/IS110/IS902 family protein [Cereibacter sphaeroides KD131]
MVRVAVAYPLQVHLIARAKTKTDKIHARVLAQLYAAGFLPEVWIPDAETEAQRRQDTRRNQLVKIRVRLKAIVQSILHAHLAPRCPHLDLLEIKGRAWVLAQEVPTDERAAIARHIEEYDRQTAAQRLVEQDIARAAMPDAEVRRLTIGCVSRFASADQLSAHLGLHPSMRQSGDGPVQHGRITKRGRSDARHLLVEAAWPAVRSPGPLRASYERFKARRGAHVGSVAVARRLAVLIWHMLAKGEDYVWGRPTLLARKMRKLELAAGAEPRRGQRGTVYHCNRPELRQADRAGAHHAEQAYWRIMKDLQRKGRRYQPAGRDVSG